MNFITSATEVAQSVQAIMVLIASLFGIGAMLSASHRQKLLRWQQAAEQGAAAIEQWRQMLKQKGLADPAPEELEAAAINKALQLAPDATAAALQPMIRAAVLNLPETDATIEKRMQQFAVPPAHLVTREEVTDMIAEAQAVADAQAVPPPTTTSRASNGRFVRAVHGQPPQTQP